MEQQLRDALEAADDKKLQRLVKQLDSNFELTVGGYDREFNWNKPFCNNERTQSVAHHVTCKMRSRQSLQMLIERVGADCLSSRNEQRETTVHCAAMHQDETWLELICSFLEQDCLDETADSGRTVAHYAARNRKTNSSLKWLIKQRGSHCLTVPDKDSETPVHHAAQYQGADSLEMIKRELGTDCFLLKGRCWNRTAIHYAACNKDSNASLKWFVKELGRDCLTVPDVIGDTPVHLAAKHQGVDSLEMIKRELGTDCFLPKGGSCTRTAIHSAACNKDGKASLKWFVKELGRDCLTVPDNFGDTPVHFAAWRQGVDSLEMIKRELGTDCFLLKGGYYNRTAIHYAALNKDGKASLKWFVKELGRDCLTVPDVNGDTPVHLAAQHQGVDSLEMIKRELGTECFLLKGGCYNRTAIHYAAFNKDGKASLKWFVKELGRDCLTVPDEDGDTPVHFAAKHQGVDSLEMIKRELGTDCFLPKGGSCTRTAIHFAAFNKDGKASLKWFVKELGRDCLTVPDNFGDTPIHRAAVFQGVDTLQFLADELGPQIFSLKNNQGQTLADFLEKDWDPGRKSSKRAWIESQPCQKQLPQPQPSVKKQQEPAASPEASAKSVLDPGFTTWDFVLDGGKKQVIGAGGFGTVYKALTDRFQTVAVKIVKLTGAKQPAELEKAIERERQGIEVLRKIRHRNIVQFLKCERAKDGRFCIFTELVSGHSLSELMERQKKPFPESGVKNFSRQICSGLNFLHNQSPTVLHRDIKCSNIMLTHEGVIKLIDFGLAKVIENTCGFSDNPSGTWHFMAPEQFGCDEACQYSVKSDVWAFGCTVFEMTEMQPPNGNLQRHQIPMLRHKNKDMPQISDQMSEALRDFYRRCVVWEPQQRADTEELLRHRFLIE